MMKTTPQIRFDRRYDDTAAAIAEYFGFQRMATAMLTALYKSGDGLQTERLRSVSGSTSPNSVRVTMVTLRSAMDAEAIDYQDGKYCLTEVGRAECAKAISECRKARMAAE